MVNPTVKELFIAPNLQAYPAHLCSVVDAMGPTAAYSVYQQASPWLPGYEVSTASGVSPSEHIWQLVAIVSGLLSDPTVGKPHRIVVNASELLTDLVVCRY